MLFESDRLLLRKMTVEDTDVYHSWRNNIEVMQSTSPSLDTYQIDETREYVHHVILGSESSKSYIMLEKATQTPIGITALINIDYKNRHAECIIDIGETDYWGKGYGGEGLGLLLDYAFLELNLHRVALRVFSFNQKAIKLYERLGFQHEGRSRQCLFRDGAWHDVIHMGVLHPEYLKRPTT